MFVQVNTSTHKVQQLQWREVTLISKMRIACIICGKDFKRRHDLERHNVVHTGTRSFTYKYCNKSFTQAGTLGRHEKHDSGEKHFSCQHWNKTFLEAGQLKHHMRVHTKQKSEFVCLFCEQYFKTSQILKIHSVVHFIRSKDSLEVALLTHSLSSRPVCLAKSCAILFTCTSAVLCHPPRDSNARGMKATSGNRQQLPSFFYQKRSQGCDLVL